MKAKLSSIAAIALALAFLLTGCSSLANTINKIAGGDGVSPVSDLNASPAGTSSPAGISATPGTSAMSDITDPATIDKQNAYIDLNNELINRFQKVVSDYVGEFGADATISVPDGFDGFTMYTTNAADYLATAMEYADKAPSVPDADAALKALQPDLAAYCQTLSDAATYYGDKNYVDDNYAKAQDYHSIIIGGYNALEAKIETFLMAVSQMLEGQDEQWLAYYQQQGLEIHYHTLKVLVTAQVIDDYLIGNNITAANIQDINLDDFKPVYDDFVTAYTGYNDAVKGNDSAGAAEGIFSLSLYSSDLSDLKSSASTLIDMLNTGKMFDDLEISSLADMTDGTPENISYCVSQLLSDYNNMG